MRAGLIVCTYVILIAQSATALTPALSQEQRG